MYFWGQKYQKPPHDVFRGIARSAALHGARKIGALAPPRGGRAAARTLFFRVKRECGFVVPPLAAKDMIKINMFRQRVLFLPRKAIPDLVPMAEKRTED